MVILTDWGSLVSGKLQQDSFFPIHCSRCGQSPQLIHRNIGSANVLLKLLPHGCWGAKVSDYGMVNLQKQLMTENSATLPLKPVTTPSSPPKWISTDLVSSWWRCWRRILQFKSSPEQHICHQPLYSLWKAGQAHDNWHHLSTPPLHTNKFTKSWNSWSFV